MWKILLKNQNKFLQILINSYNMKLFHGRNLKKIIMIMENNLFEVIAF
jgi:hypothetical protein